MAKRYTDTTIWKNQRWFKQLSPHHKLAWKYLTDLCDHAGIWKIDFGQLVEDIGVDKFILTDFITACNYDFDKETGKKISRERIKLINKKTIWLTGYIKFQYENKEFLINPCVPAINSALTILNSYGTLNEALDKGYFTLSKPYTKGMTRTKDMDIDKDKDNKPFEDSKGGLGETKGTLTYEMVNFFKANNPNYPIDKEMDYHSCLKIAYKIAEIKKWSKDSVVNGRLPDVLDAWETIVFFVKTDPWFSKRSITDLEKEFQRLIQSMSNAGVKQSNVGSSKSAGAHELVDRLKDKIAAGRKQND